jgi:hypothetical protein
MTLDIQITTDEVITIDAIKYRPTKKGRNRWIAYAKNNNEQRFEMSLWWEDMVLLETLTGNKADYVSEYHSLSHEVYAMVNRVNKFGANGIKNVCQRFEVQMVMFEGKLCELQNADARKTQYLEDLDNCTEFETYPEAKFVEFTINKLKGYKVTWEYQVDYGYIRRNLLDNSVSVYAYKLS